MEGFHDITPHQPPEGDSEGMHCDEELVSSDSDDNHVDLPQPALVRSHGGKRPFTELVPSDDDDQPDLSSYFRQWDIPVKDVIALCRAYANFLSQQYKATRPSEKTKKYR